MVSNILIHQTTNRPLTDRIFWLSSYTILLNMHLTKLKHAAHLDTGKYHCVTLTMKQTLFNRPAENSRIFLQFLGNNSPLLPLMIQSWPNGQIIKLGHKKLSLTKTKKIIHLMILATLQKTITIWG